MGRGREKEKQAGELDKLRGTSVRPGWPGTARLRPPAGLGRNSPAPASSSLFSCGGRLRSLAGRSGCESKETIDRGREAASGDSPRAAAPPQPVRALRETPLAPRGSSAARGSSPAAASPPGLRHPLAFSVTQVRKTLKVCNVRGYKESARARTREEEEGCAETRRSPLPLPRPASAPADAAVAPPGDCFLEGAPEPAVPSWKKLEQAGMRAAAGPRTLDGQGQENPCPGRLASGRKTRLCICSDGELE